MKPTTIRIGPRDAALVLHADGTLDTWLPHIHRDPPANAVAASALMFAYSDGKLMPKIYEAMAAAGFAYLDPPPNSLDPRDPEPSIQ